ncbi:MULTISPECIES: LD-carboxypeptidase [unclassified Sporosarcina]|uniref:S66 peptidase family protein n=1 Tax=unclassified Sporosarcina TaxID=2647733 RepID=UPI000C17291E|nr:MULTISPECIES: LD-carboxypeptidase [unclassified Sporosarcina]PID04658.1 LD-carboxypeptidase [Sporosarcina sp. P30]PID07765.1 LD-carboxypeptidase [Sporosarcina sp. P31]PID10998.1 LD-carboxypeptidase [Sporosarcina sp. P32b]
MATKPQQLKRGDTVGIVTLGSPLAANRITEGIRMLQTMGYKVVVGEHVYSANGFLAATPQQRASDLMKMFKNPEVKWILPTRGGVGVAGVLPFLDFNVIKQNPKIVSGYSDITILLNVLFEYADLIGFQSLLLLDFKAGTPAYNFNQFFAATSNVTAPWQIMNPPEVPLVGLVPGNVTGPIVGGNLTSFVGTLGTSYEINTEGRILLLEETHEPINTVYRYVNHLAMAGKFDDCVGIIMGQCTNCDSAYGKSYVDLINEFIVPLGKPLLTNLASAHSFYKATVPIGASVRMDTVNRTLTVTEPVVK